MTYSQKANPNATNSELDAKKIVKNVQLTSLQRDELISQYSEIVVDNMDMQDLICYAQEQLVNYLDSLSDIEIKEEIDNHDEELYDELVDNVTNEIAPSKVTITDDDYADKVDTLVGNMVANDDNVFTHDSEGC